jgi:hypothetical protein
MSSRAARLRALSALCGVAALLTAAVIAVSAAGAVTSSRTNRQLIIHCSRLIADGGRTGARALPGSADPQVAGALSIFRATRTSIDTLPAAGNLGHALGGAEARTYDPSASVRLHVSGMHSGALYAVPATLAAPRLPARCAHVSGFGALRAVLALRTLRTGSGPGICLIRTQVLPALEPVSPLPGEPPLRGTGGPQTAATAGCESLAVMQSYLGGLGGALAGAGVPVVVAPDGVTSVTYTLGDGRQFTAAVTGNLVALPGKATGSVHLGKAGRARLLRVLGAQLPVSVTEGGAGGVTVTTYARPPSLISELVKEFLALKRLLTISTTGSEDSYVSCTARTHRCVAVVVSSSCNVRSHRCTMTRRIKRYRYVTRRPPRGTTGHVVVPTGPIRARVNRYVRRPGRLSLVLSGPPHRRVDVLVEISCFSPRNGGSESGQSRAPLQVAVPSRTRLGTVRRHHGCGVNALVVSSRPGPIHARLAHG